MLSSSAKKIRLQTKLPGPKSLVLMERRRSEVARGPFHATPLFIERSEGALVEDVDGNQLIDLAAGIAVNNVGSRSPNVIKKVKAQLDRFLHSAFNVTPYENYLEVCEKLNHAFPGSPPFKRKSFLANSGAEAVENAIKIARAFTGKQAVVCFEHAFHGRTYLAMTLTAKYKPYKYGFAPFNPEVYRAPFPYAYRWPTTADEEKVSEECFAAFEDLVQSQIAATQVAAVILEPIAGEGGFISAPKEFLKRLREFCTQNKIVLIADEIQTGFGRTGSLFACDQLGLTPDLLITAKGLGGGFPLSAVTGRADIMDGPIDGGIGGTFSGNPVSCAAALGVFETMDSSFLGKVSETGEVLRERLQQWREKFPHVGDVRGLGLMQAIEFVKSKSSKIPDPDSAKALTKYAYEHGVILMSAGTYGNVVRFLPPLTIEHEVLNEALDILEAGLVLSVNR